MLAPLLPVPQPVAAAGQRLEWNDNGDSFTRIGLGGPITIHTGTILFECDFTYHTADVYIVPAGSVGVGSTLTDVGGAPNTVFGLSGGLFIEETIGYAGQNGLGLGT